MTSDPVSDILMKLQGNCPNCGTKLTFKEAALLAKDNGIKEDAVMCHKCNKAYTVELTLQSMTFKDEVNTDFINNNKQVSDKKTEIDEKTVNDNTFNNNSNNMVQNNRAYNKNMINNQNQFNQQSNIQNKDDNSIFALLFYKKDKLTNQYRISKSKTISILLFILLFIMFVVTSSSYLSSFNYVESLIINIITSFILALIITVPVFIIGYLISYLLDRNKGKPMSMNNQQNMGYNNYPNNNNQYNNYPYNQQNNINYNNIPVNNQQNNMDYNYQQNNQQNNQEVNTNTNEQQNKPDIEKDYNNNKSNDISTQEETKYYEKDNMGTRQDTIEKANAYWLGERFHMEIKPPFTLYMFENAKDAEEALLELPYIHKAEDTGNLICDNVFQFGYYKVSENNYEAIVCGKDLTLEEYQLAEEAFKKHDGKLKNNLEPEKRTRKTSTSNGNGVRFRETIKKDQFTYECYDADTREEAQEFLKGKPVTQRLYYVCVYTPEGNYGRDIDGIYQM